MRIAVCLLALLAAPAFSQLTQGERDRAVSELHATRKQFLDETAGLSAAQWSFKPGPKVWSVGEVAEHIALAEDFLFQIATVKAMHSPAESAKKGAAAGRDESIIQATEDRTHKAQAPEPLVPTHRWGQAETIEHFRSSRDRTIDYMLTTSDDLRGHFLGGPNSQPMDAYQWILFLAAHSQRHIQQIREVKSNPNFPKK